MQINDDDDNDVSLLSKLGEGRISMKPLEVIRTGVAENRRWTPVSSISIGNTFMHTSKWFSEILNTRCITAMRALSIPASNVPTERILRVVFLKTQRRQHFV